MLTPSLFDKGPVASRWVAEAVASLVEASGPSESSPLRRIGAPKPNSRPS